MKYVNSDLPGRNCPQNRASIAMWNPALSRSNSTPRVSIWRLLPPSVASSSVECATASLVTDGPFAGSHEQLGEFFLIDAQDLDERSRSLLKRTSRYR